MRRLFVTATFVLAAGSSAAAQAGVVDVCVGDSFVIEAPKGWLMTYTEPRYAAGWPNMFAEQSAARAAQSPSGTAAVPWEIRPNAALLTAPSSGSVNQDKLSPKYNPAAYVQKIALDGSRLTVRARFEQPGLVRYWMLDPRTGEYGKHELLVRPAQCGASSFAPSRGIGDLCEGAAEMSPMPLYLDSSNPGMVYVYRGATSGAEGVAGVRAGRAVLSDPRFASERSGVLSKVSLEGTNRCPDRHPGLEPVSDGRREMFALSLCVGEWWVSPVSELTSVAGVVVEGRGAFAEPDAIGGGFGIYGLEAGVATVFVSYEHPDAAGAILRVEVNECEQLLDLLP